MGFEKSAFVYEYFGKKEDVSFDVESEFNAKARSRFGCDQVTTTGDPERI